MKLVKLELRSLNIPFRVSFKHAAAERSATQAVIAAVEDSGNTRGFGEGCPREYVTGESVASCQVFLERYQESILKISSMPGLRDWTAAHAEAIDQNPAAWCAVETALLDLFGKIEGRSIEQVVGGEELSGGFKYSAVLGASAPKIFQAQLRHYADMGFQDFKVKVSGERELDRMNIGALVTTVPGAKIRLDANNLWSSGDKAAAYVAALGAVFWAIEEPLAVGDFKGLEWLANTLGCKIILDESFLRLSQLEQLGGAGKIWLPNIRISKMGGLLRSLQIAEECRRLGMNVILGAQVGETSILTRVALTVANRFKDTVVAQEGAFGTRLLERDITVPPLQFEDGGILNPATIGGSGLGLEVKL